MSAGGMMVAVACWAAAGGAAAAVSPPAPPHPASSAASGLAERAPATPARAWIATGLASELSEGGGGHGFALDHLLTTAEGRTWTAGLTAQRIIDTRWLVARLGLAQPLGPATVLFAEVGGGPGRRERAVAGNSTDGFTVVDLRLGAVWGLAPGRLYLRLEDRYLDFAPQRGQVAQGTLTWLPAAGWTLAAGGGRSFSGDLGTDYATVRLDAPAGGGWRWLAGGALGTVSGPEVGLPAVHGAGRDLEQLFGGLALPLGGGGGEGGGGELLVVLDRLEVGAVRRDGLTLSLRWPGGGGSGGSARGAGG